MKNDERLSRYLDGELTPEEAEETARRIAESPELRQAFEEMKELERTLQSAMPRMNFRTPSKPPRRKRPWLAAVAAAAVILVFAGVGYGAVLVYQEALLGQTSVASSSDEHVIAEATTSPVQSSVTVPIVRQEATAPEEEPKIHAPEFVGNPVKLVVTNFDDESIGRASVRVFERTYEQAGTIDLREIARGRTDNEGRMNLPPPNVWNLAKVQHPDYEEFWVRNDPSPPENAFEIEAKLFRPQTVAGRVVNARGIPIANAEVSSRYRVLSEAIHMTRTDADGRFSLRGRPNSDISIFHPEYAYGIARVPYDGQIDSIILKPGNSLRVRVVQNGSPVSDAPIQFRNVGGSALPTLEGSTDENGEIVFANVPTDDDYVVSATIENGVVHAGAKVASGYNNLTTLKIPFEYPGRVYGWVTTEDGAPVSNTGVQAQPSEYPEYIQRATTDESGYYEMALPAGEYNLTWMGRTKLGWKTETAHRSNRIDPSGTEVEESFVLSRQETFKTELFAENTDLRPSRVALMHYGSIPTASHTWLNNAEQGLFSYTVNTDPYIYDPMRNLIGKPDPHNQESGRNAQGQTTFTQKNQESLVANQPATTMQGRVVDPSGVPIPGVRVNAGDGSLPRYGVTETDRYGRFKIAAILPDSKFRVGLQKSGYSPPEAKSYENISISANEEPVDLVMVPAELEIKGRVFSLDGFPLPEASVVLISSSRDRNVKITDPQGAFRFRVPPGSYYLDASVLEQEAYRVGPIEAPATGVNLIVQAYLYDQPEATGPPAEFSKREISNKLKQLGLSFKMFANESRGEKYPVLSSRFGAFYPEISSMYPEYVPDPAMLPLLRGDGDTRFIYFGHLVKQPVTAHAFLDQYETYGSDHLAGKDLQVDDGVGNAGMNTIFQLREGIERFLITDINDPNAGGRAQSTIPLMWQMPTAESGGGYVLYLDGHTEWVEYPGRFPMEETVIERVRGIIESATPATTP